MACQHTDATICQTCVGMAMARAQQETNVLGSSIQGIYAMTAQTPWPKRKFRVTLANGDVAEHEAASIGFEGGGLQLAEHPMAGGKVLLAFAPSVWVSVREE